MKKKNFCSPKSAQTQALMLFWPLSMNLSYEKALKKQSNLKTNLNIGNKID
jgi:hypothetical protein